MRIRFNDYQLKVISGITADAGQVFLASTVVPVLFGVDKLNIKILLFGLVLTLICWVSSVIIVKGKLK